jgi:hypothetical protein
MERLKELLKENFEICKDPRELSNRIAKIKKAMKDSKEPEKEVRIREFYEFKHPLFKKLIDWGGIGRDVAGELKSNLLRIDESSRRDIEEFQRKLEEFRDKAVRYIYEKASDPAMGLRPVHGPGCAGRTEARNLYFGENYNQTQLQQLAYETLSSICFGYSVSFYFEDEKFQLIIRRRLANQGAEHFDLGELKVLPSENDKPHVILVKFILWLYEEFQRQNSEEKNLLKVIIQKLKETTGKIYVAPGKEKEEYLTLPLPSLHFFVSWWIEKEEKRTALYKMMNEMFNFYQEVRKEARRRKLENKVENSSKILANELEILCKHILETGMVEYNSLRRIEDMLVELSLNFEKPLHLASIREFL